MAYEELRAATSSPLGRSVHFGDGGHTLRVSCGRTDGADGSRNVVDPDLLFCDKLSRLNPGPINRQREEDLHRVGLISYNSGSQ